jgi:hypothetical protein
MEASLHPLSIGLNAGYRYRSPAPSQHHDIESVRVVELVLRVLQCARPILRELWRWTVWRIELSVWNWHRPLGRLGIYCWDAYISYNTWTTHRRRSGAAPQTSQGLECLRGIP